MNYFAIQCFPDTYNLVREGPNITPHVTDLMVHAKKILGHEGRCAKQGYHNWIENFFLSSIDTFSFSLLRTCRSQTYRIVTNVWLHVLKVAKKARDASISLVFFLN